MASFAETLEQIRAARQAASAQGMERGATPSYSPASVPSVSDIFSGDVEGLLSAAAEAQPGRIDPRVYAQEGLLASNWLDEQGGMPSPDSSLQQFMERARAEGGPQTYLPLGQDLVPLDQGLLAANWLNAQGEMPDAVEAIRKGADAAKIQKENQQTESLLGGIFDNPIVKQLVAGLAAPEFLASQYGLGGRSPVAALVGGMQANQAREIARTKEAAKLQEEMRRQQVKEEQEQQKIDILQQKADREPTGKPAARGEQLRNILTRSLSVLRKQKTVDDIIEGKTSWWTNFFSNKPTEAELIPVIIDKAQEEYIKNPNAGFDAAVLKALGKGAATAQSQKPAQFGQARIK